MKRVWTKKIKVVPACAVNNDRMEEHRQQVEPQVKRKIRTSAAMIGLIISTGASNLLISQPSDSAPVIEPRVNQPIFNQNSTAATAVPSESLNTGEPKAQKSVPVENVFTVVAPTSLIQLQPKALETVATTASPVVKNGVQKEQIPSQLQSARIDTTTTIQPEVVAPTKSLLSKSENQAEALRIRQNKLIQRLKAAKTLANSTQEDKFSRSQIESPVTVNSQIQPAGGVVLAETKTDNSVLTTEQKQLVERLRQKVVAAQPSTERSPQLVSTLTNDAQLPQQSINTVVVVELPQSVVNQPTVVVPATMPAYQVKAGDTLTAIAKYYGVSLAQLLEVNHLNDPNHLQVNQKIQVPARQHSSAAGDQRTQDQLLPTGIQLKSDTASLEPLPNTETENTGYFGVGGNISDDDTVQASAPTVNQISSTESSSQSEVQSDLYVQNLRAEIQKLRQKYSAQRAAISQTVPVAAQTTIPITTANSAQVINDPVRSQPLDDQPLNSEFYANQTAPKQRSIAQPAAPRKVSRQLATATVGLDNTEGQQVTPELPPLGTVDTYLPKTTQTAGKGLIWPSKGALTSGYGWRWGRMHKGIDIAAPIGTPIVAAASGVVVKAGWNSGGYGNLVDIQHTDGTLTRYAHNKRILVQAGQQVEQGQQISEMGSTGFSTGPHLHFEVHLPTKKAVNPMAYLQR